MDEIRRQTRRALQEVPVGPPERIPEVKSTFSKVSVGSRPPAAPSNKAQEIPEPAPSIPTVSSVAFHEWITQDSFGLVAKHVLRMAAQLAHEYQQTDIDSAHIFVALSRENNCIAYRSLQALEISRVRIEEICSQILLGQQLIVQGQRLINGRIVPLPLDGGQDLDFWIDAVLLPLAMQEREKSSHAKVNTGHLLLALTRMEKSYAPLLFRRLNIDAQALAAYIRKYLQENPLAENS